MSVNAAYWGISENGSRNATPRSSVEQHLGRKFNGVRRNIDYKIPFTGYNMEARKEFLNGYIGYYRNFAFVDKTANPDVRIPFKDVAAGKYDTLLLEYAHGVDALGLYSDDAPFMLSPHHEQNVDQPNEIRQIGTPADYVAQHRHIFNLYKENGLLVDDGGPIAICFTPLQSQILSPTAMGWPLAKVDPGPEYYHIFGVDYYNKRDTQGIVGLHYGTNAADTFGTIIQAALDRGKPWAVFEFSIAGGNAQQEQEKAHWLDTFTGLLSTMGGGWGPGRCLGLYWTNEGSATSPGRPDSSPVVIDSMKRMLQAVYTPPPIQPPPVPVFM
jgi:hypothetical protein